MSYSASPANPANLRLRGLILLVIVTLIWGTNFPLIKDAASSLSPSVIVATRCAVALIAFLPWLRGLSLSLWRDGAILGCMLFAPLAIQAIAVETICANRAAFIVGLNVILVPLLGQFLGQRLMLRSFIAAGIAFAGIGIMSWENGAICLGDVLMFFDAVAYSIYILVLDSASNRHPPLPLTAVQMLVVALISAAWAAPEISGQLAEIQARAGSLIYLGLIDTAISTWLQVIAQQWVPAHEMALTCALEPVFAAIFSFFLLGEQLGARGFLGAAMVLSAMFISQKASKNSAASSQVIEPEILHKDIAGDLVFNIDGEAIAAQELLVPVILPHPEVEAEVYYPAASDSRFLDLYQFSKS